MFCCKYVDGCILIGRCVVKDMATLEYLICKIKNKMGGISNERRFYRYKGVLDLLASARNDYLLNLEGNYAQIFSGRSEDTSEAV